MSKIAAALFAMALSAFCLGEKCLAEEPIVHTVDFPKGDAAWSITFQVEDLPALPGQPKPPKVKPTTKQRAKIDIVRKGNLRHDIVTWSDGSTTEYWWNGTPAFVLFQDGADGHIYTMKSGNMNDSRMDETFFTWISAGTFKGMQSFQEKNCRYYEMEITLPNGDKTLRRGWIDNKTARPVCWTESSILSIFSFDVPLPPEPLVLPDKFKKELDRIQSFFVFPKRTSASQR